MAGNDSLRSVGTKAVSFLPSNPAANEISGVEQLPKSAVAAALPVDDARALELVVVPVPFDPDPLEFFDPPFPEFEPEPESLDDAEVEAAAATEDVDVMTCEDDEATSDAEVVTAEPPAVTVTVLGAGQVSSALAGAAAADVAVKTMREKAATSGRENNIAQEKTDNESQRKGFRKRVSLTSTSNE